MNPARHYPDAARARRGAACLAVLVAVLSTGLLLPLSGAQAATTVPLGTAESFAVLAGSTITNTGPSTVTGDIGLHPGTSVTGFGTLTQNGSLHVANGVALQAKNDLTVAYTNAAGQTPVTRVPTELGTTTLTAGVYDSAAGTFGVTGPLTLDGQGNPDAVFIFKMASTLTTASASSVNLINGADICNVFWQVGSSATLGSNSTFRGTIMADQSITLNNGATIQGRALAREGAVTMNTNTITNTACAAPADTENDTPVADDTPTDGDTPVDGDAPSDGDASEGTPTDGDTTEGTPTNGDTTGGTSTDGGTTGGTPTDGDTTGQVTRVPSGGVAAGGGSGAVPGGVPQLVVWTLLLVAAAGTAGVAVRRRVRV